eukprot:CAMPEP_0172605380 /NCGR_PEP_ID=MMETSP1068-20121228/25615_1 /TAXON_ID=35684 /ORGANISM="Pseudopedinella elastica, Strain CCMP716" /LENGTH=1105 /DNA_ID=CAMNT_0013407767 /DNA_START=13 /DNA_END=3331 /DNA_ORIENTATION=-
MAGSRTVLSFLATVVVALAFNPAIPAGKRWTTVSRGTVRRNLVEQKPTDAFQELLEAGGDGPKLIKDMPSALNTAVLNGVVPALAAAAAGASWAVLPPPVAAVAAYGGSILGAQGRRKMVPAMDAAAKLELAELLAPGDYTSITPTTLEAIQTKYKVPDEVFTDIKVDLYAKFLVAMLRSPEFKTSELKECAALKEALAMDGEALGDAFFACAEEIYTTKVAWTNTKVLEDPESLERMTLDKCAFLASRVMGDHDTAEGAAYTLARIVTILQLESKQDLEDRCFDVAMPLYQTALDTVLTKLESVTYDNLAKARASLGLSDRQVVEEHESVFTNELCSIMEKADFQLDKDGVARLAKLAEVLGVSDADREAMVLEQIIPVFEFDINDVMARMMEDPTAEVSEAVGVVCARMAGLSMTPKQAQSVIVNCLKANLAKPFEQAVSYARVDNAKGALGAMQATLESKEAAAIMLEALEENKLVPVEVVDEFFNSALPPVSSSIAKQLYTGMLLDALEAEEPEVMDAVAELEPMLGLTDADVLAIYNKECGPVLNTKLKENLWKMEKGECSPEEAKQALDEYTSAARVPGKVLESVSMSTYQERLESVTSEGKIMSKDERADLDNLRTFLSIADADVLHLHLAASSDAYKKSCAEAFSAASNGIVSAEYREGLAKVADRLMISEEDASKLFNLAARAHLEPMAKKLVDVFERNVLTKEQYAQKHGTDDGEDFTGDGTGDKSLGIGEGSGNADLPGACLALAQFFEGNGLLPEESDEEGAKEESPKYAVTASGLFQEKMFEELFRTFKVKSMQEQAGSKYDLAAKHLGGLLGLPEGVTDRITSELGADVYKNFVGQLLNTKGTVEPGDFQQLVTIQQSLGMGEDEAMELLWSLKKGFVAKKIESALSVTTNPDGSTIAEIKAVAKRAGVDIGSDMELEAKTLMKLFLADAKDAVLSGRGLDKATGEPSPEVLSQVQEDWGVETDVAGGAFEEMVKSGLAKAAEQAQGALQRDDQKTALEALEELIAFSPFAGEGAKVENEAMKVDLVKVYKDAKADYVEGLNEEDAKKLETLEAALGASVLHEGRRKSPIGTPLSHAATKINRTQKNPKAA